VRIRSVILVIPFLLSLVVYGLASRSRRVRRPVWHVVLDLAFLAYAFVVVGALYFPLRIDPGATWDPTVHLNLVPIVNTVKSYRVSIQYGLLDWIVPLLFGNLLVFVPLAFYLAVRFPGKERRSFAMLLVVSVGAEVLQFLLDYLLKTNGRVTDIDDLLLNAIGGIGGWLIARSILRGRERKPTNPSVREGRRF